jgi:hypothetical protein
VWQKFKSVDYLFDSLLLILSIDGSDDFYIVIGQ